MHRSAVELLRCPRTGQRLDVRPLSTTSDDSVEFGTLSADAFEYPIVAGIAVLTVDSREILELVHEGRFQEAVAAAALGTSSRSRALPFVEAGAEWRIAARPLGALTDVLRRRERRENVKRLFGAERGTGIVTDPIALLFLDGRRPVVEGYNYFRFRFGTPRYLVALALIDALPEMIGPSVDVGCGAGHLTWALTQRSTSEPVIGVDPSFAQLLAATRLAPNANFVCADGRSLPLRTGSFHRVLSSDVLPYISGKPAATRELVRVLREDGQLVLTALRNAHQRHVHGGEPLSPKDWAGLIENLPHVRLLGDDQTLDLYLDRLSPGALDDARADESQTVSIIAGHGEASIRTGRWITWPHALGPLAPHPLLREVSKTSVGTKYVRQFPSPTFAEDHRRVVEYLPSDCIIPFTPTTEGIDAPLEAPVLDALISTVALLGLPASEVRAQP